MPTQPTSRKVVPAHRHRTAPARRVAGRLLLGLAAWAHAQHAHADEPGSLPPALRAHVTALADADRTLRIEAAWRLGNLGTTATGAVPFLIGLLPDHGTMTDGRLMLWQRPDNPWSSELTSPGREAAKALVRIGPTAIDPLLAALASETNVSGRVNAMFALGEFHEPRATALLTSHANIWQPEAMEALRKIGDPRAIPALMKTFNQHEGFVVVVTDVLVSFGAPSIEPLLAHLRNPSAPNRHVALRALARLGDPRGLQAATDALRAPDLPMQRAALGALALFPPQPAAGEALTSLLGSPDWRLRRDALDALARLRDRAHLPAILKTLQDSDLTVRGHAALAAGAVGDASAADPVAALLADRAVFPRKAAIEALIALHDPRALGGLDALIRHGHGGTRIDAAALLAKLATPPAAELLAPLTVADEAPVRAAAAEALRTIGAPAAEPYARYLSAQAGAIDWEVLGAAVAWLAQLGPAAAAPMAREFVLSPNWQFPARVRPHLTAFGEAVVDPLLAAARGREGDWQRMERIADVLAAQGARNAVTPLIGLLEHKDTKVADSALKGLVRITGQSLGQDPAAWRTWLEAK